MGKAAVELMWHIWEDLGERSGETDRPQEVCQRRRNGKNESDGGSETKRESY